MATTFTLPELGENIEAGKVTKVMVAVGDTVKKDQPVVELETDKAVVEVPAPTDGTVTEIRAVEGEDLRVGEVILVIEDSGASPPASAVEKIAVTSVAGDSGNGPEKTPVSEPPAEALAVAPAPRETAGPLTGKVRRAASPTVRRLAREIGVNVQEVVPKSPTGRISLADIKNFAKSRIAGAGDSGLSVARQMKLPDFAKWGEIERVEMSGVRRATAERMDYAWATIPHVTQHDLADITRLETLRKKYGKKAAAAGGKLTVTAIVVKVLASALKQFPQFSASIDMEKREVVMKRYYSVGVAVDTDRGLLVPVIRDADKKNVTELSVELSELAGRARERKLKLDEMQGACITVTNLGGIGGTSFTPIINPPEVAILGLSRGRVTPVEQDGAFVPRMLMPLSLSYDHRVIDGADAARFTRWICEVLEEPFLLFLEG